MVEPGTVAPSFRLPASGPGGHLADPWQDGPTVLAFFKVTCPTCKLAAPAVQALADAGVRVVAVGQDPPDALDAYAATYGQVVPTASDTAPYPVSDAYGIHHVPTLILVGADGVVAEAVAGWDREGWNRVAAAAGAGPVSTESDGLPSFRPG